MSWVSFGFQRAVLRLRRAAQAGIADAAGQSIVVLNGVQRVPALLNEVHRAIEGAADRSCSGRWRYSQLSFGKASELVRDRARIPRC